MVRGIGRADAAKDRKRAYGKEAPKMLEVQRSYARKLVGKAVQVARASGSIVEGDLMSFNGHSLWLVQGDKDEFISIHDVVGLVSRVA